MSTDAQTETRAIPEFIRPWTAPFHVTMDGIKDAKGCWVCSAGNSKLAHQLIELMNYAAESATALAAKDAELERLRKSDAEWGRVHQGVIEDRAAEIKARKAVEARLAEAMKALEPDALASTVANIRQGESSTPRCEPPSDYDVGIARVWVVRVLKAIDIRRAREAQGGENVKECATEGCDNAATIRFERGGVGSDYCGPCYLKVQAIPNLTTEPAAPEGEPVTLTYKNWRGEVAERTITPKRVWFGATDWHPERQWLLTAFDHDKQADRDFALKDFGAENLLIELRDGAVISGVNFKLYTRPTPSAPVEKE